MFSENDWKVKEPKKKESEKQSYLAAKKSFVINHNGFHKEIKKGDDLSDVPKIYHQNLKTEGVI